MLLLKCTIFAWAVGLSFSFEHYHTDTYLENYNLSDIPFPEDFRFGAATSAYQVEGAWNVDGKGESMWDWVMHNRLEETRTNETGDIACDHYHKYKEDIALMKDLGIYHYRFSIAWTRILPTGYANNINQKGIDHYKDVIRELKRQNMEPYVTLYHWDLPQPLSELGGWTNPLIVDWFGDYARVIYENFGDEVKNFVTINEPKQVCIEGYGNGVKAPLIKSSGYGDYLCNHYLLLAHAKAWHIYNDEFRAKQNGRVAIVLDTFWFEPETESNADKEAAYRALMWGIGINLHPIYIGDYPQVIIDRVAERSKKGGYPRSRLPKFTPEEVEYVKGTSDYLGLNFYTNYVVKDIPEPPYTETDRKHDIKAYEYWPNFWDEIPETWIRNTPWGLKMLLKYIKENYNNPEIFIMENGVPDSGSFNDDKPNEFMYYTVVDPVRVRYHKIHLSHVQEARMDYKVNVTGYTFWAFMDNLEWMIGTEPKFGLYQVDFDDPNLTRSPKSSVAYIKRLIETRCLVPKCRKK